MIDIYFKIDGERVDLGGEDAVVVECARFMMRKGVDDKIIREMILSCIRESPPDEIEWELMIDEKFPIFDTPYGI